MAMPGFTADFSAYRSDAVYASSGSATSPASTGVVPQLSACTPCVQLGGGRHCFNLIGRRICVNIPSFGRWRICCRTRWGWPPFRCSVGRC